MVPFPRACYVSYARTVDALTTAFHAASAELNTVGVAISQRDLATRIEPLTAFSMSPSLSGRHSRVWLALSETRLLGSRVPSPVRLRPLTFGKPTQQFDKALRQWLACDRFSPFAQDLPDRASDP